MDKTMNDAEEHDGGGGGGDDEDDGTHIGDGNRTGMRI